MLTERRLVTGRFMVIQKKDYVDLFVIQIHAFRKELRLLPQFWEM